MTMANESALVQVHDPGRRLAERVLVDLMHYDVTTVHDGVDAVMPLLEGEAESRFCTLLGHPRTCPHGDPIPAGSCCPVAG